ITLKTGGGAFALQTAEVSLSKEPMDREFTLALPPAHVLEGTVVYGDTGKPAANARLRVTTRRERFSPGRPAMHDLPAHAEGRFHVVPYVGTHHSVIAYPPDGAPYLLHNKEFDWPKADVVRHQVKLTLTPGVLVKGTVTEAGSGQPVAGASVQFEPRYDDNP